MKHGGNDHALSRSRMGRSAVFAYLETVQGSDCPTDIGGLLVGLDWSRVGCLEGPSHAQVHLARQSLEDLAYLEAADEASDRRLHAQESGLFAQPMTLLSIYRHR